MPWTALALTVVAAGLAWVGGRDRDGWFDGLERPGWLPGRRGLGAAWAVRLLAAGAAGWLILDERGWGLTAGLWVAQVVMAFVTPGLFFGARRLSTSFTWLCLEWVAVGLAAAAAWVFVPPAGWILVGLLGLLTWLGAGGFFVWQLNEPSRGPV
ncbi:MAG: tryptophan-rich sensory protein [Acidimicrobiia bacterium]|nr:tryptophan-rich sensory protein [Acidimicrobiia bacterium]